MDRHTSETILLRARSLIRVNRLLEAKTWLILNAARHRQDDAVGTSAMLMGAICAQMNEFEKANEWFDLVDGLRSHHTIDSECRYLRAMSCYLAGDLDGAKRFGAMALRPAEDIVYARTRSLFGWIAVTECEYPRAYTEFLGSLDVLDRCVADDTHLRATIVSALAITAAEAQVGDPKLLDAEFSKVRWNPGLAKHQLQALRHCGFVYETCGDSRTAMQRHAAAAEVAPGTVWAMYGYAACANLASRLGQREAAEAFAFMAMSVESRISESVGWQDIDDEERISLLELALVLARLGNGSQAQRYRDIYHDNTRLSALSSLHHDLRLATYKKHVDAMIAVAVRNDRESFALLSAVAKQWAVIGCARRAQETSRDLASTKDRSPAADEALPPDAEPQRKLSRRDVAIVQLVAFGLKNAEIADRLCIAPKTVKNRLAQIYKAYGVHDRTNLALLGKSAAPAC